MDISTSTASIFLMNTYFGNISTPAASIFLRNTYFMNISTPANTTFLLNTYFMNIFTLENTKFLLNTYFMNISTPVASIFLLMAFHDFCNKNSWRGERGRRGSVGGGPVGSGTGRALPFEVSLSTLDWAHPITREMSTLYIQQLFYPFLWILTF